MGNGVKRQKKNSSGGKGFCKTKLWSIGVATYTKRGDKEEEL